MHSGQRVVDGHPFVPAVSQNSLPGASSCPSSLVEVRWVDGWSLRIEN